MLIFIGYLKMYFNIKKKEEVSKKERMFNQIKEERRKYLKLASLEDKKIDLEKWIIIIHS